MSLLHAESVDSLLSLTAVDGDAVLADMEAQAERDGFPTIGHEVGSFLRLCARLTDAESVFEFGSGFGYSAYWVAPALDSDDRIVLTEVDEDELDQARTYLDRGGYADRAVFEAGDALDVVEDYEGPFDIALIDHQNGRYIEAFEAVRDKIAPGGVVVADNVLHSSGDGGFTPADLEASLNGDGPEDGESDLEPIVDYYHHVRDDPAFETSTVPIGEGLFVSVRT